MFLVNQTVHVQVWIRQKEPPPRVQSVFYGTNQPVLRTQWQMYKSQYDPDWYHHHHLYSYNLHQLPQSWLQWFCLKIFICSSDVANFSKWQHHRLLDLCDSNNKNVIWKTNCYFPVRRQFYIHIIITKKRILRCPEIMKRNRHCFDKNKTPVSRPSISRHSSYCSRIPASWVESWLSIHHHHQGPQDILVENLECAAPLVVAVLWSKYVYVSTYLMGHNVIHENNHEASFSFDLCSIEIWWYDFDRCQLIGWMAI